MFYLYRFINFSGEIIYIGRTNDINRRIINEHFTNNTHLPADCYLETEKIEYTKIENESEEVAYEAILINKIRPKYNSQFIDNGSFVVELPDFKWFPFEWQYENQFNWLKERKRRVIGIRESLDDFVRTTWKSSITTGLDCIDEKIIMPSQSMTVIAGASGIGKTSYCLNVANHNAQKGRRVLFVSLKDSIEYNTKKILSIDSLVPLKNIVLQQMCDEEWEKFEESITRVYEANMLFYNVNADFFNLDSIIAEINRYTPDLIIIDDVQMIEYNGKDYAKDKLEYILKNIKKIAIQLSIPVVLSYCIPNNELQNRMDFRPVMSDLNYNSLNIYADNILLLYRDEVYNEATTLMNIAEINVVKSIFDEKQTIQIYFVNGRFVDKENKAKDEKYL